MRTWIIGPSVAGRRLSKLLVRWIDRDSSFPEYNIDNAGFKLDVAAKMLSRGQSYFLSEVIECNSQGG
jgi:hypothetical protein